MMAYLPVCLDGLLWCCLSKGHSGYVPPCMRWVGALSLPCADDKFRANFLWGRKPMLAACAARLQGRRDMIWVDLGGGTGVSGGAATWAMMGWDAREGGPNRQSSRWGAPYHHRSPPLAPSRRTRQCGGGAVVPLGANGWLISS